MYCAIYLRSHLLVQIFFFKNMGSKVNQSSAVQDKHVVNMLKYSYRARYIHQHFKELILTADFSSIVFPTRQWQSNILHVLDHLNSPYDPSESPYNPSVGALFNKSYVKPVLISLQDINL